MRSILKILYRVYPRYFEEFIVEDFISQTPEKVQDDAMSFLGQGRVRLEKWIFFNSYHLQRRMVGDPANAQIYQGMLLIFKILLSLTSQSVVSENKNVSVEIPKDEAATPEQDIEFFVTGIKNIKKEQEDTA